MRYYRILSAAILAGAILSSVLFTSAAELSSANIEIVGIEEVPKDQIRSNSAQASQETQRFYTAMTETIEITETETETEMQTEEAAEPETETPSEKTFESESETQTDKTAAPAKAAQGLFEIASALDGDYVLDVRHCIVQDTDSQSIQLYHSLNVNQQKFYLESLPGKAFRISVLHTGDVLTALPDDGSVAMAAMEHPENAPASETQSWIFERAPHGYFYIKAQSGQYLTLDSFHSYAGAPVVLGEFTGDVNQLWRLSNTWISSEDYADTDLVNPYGEDGPYDDLRITLLFGEHTETITADDLSAQITENEEHELVFDSEYLDAFVEQLAEKYDTQGQPKRFRTSYGNEITLYEGDFGWKLDKSTTKNLLLEYLETNQVRFLRPVWAHKGRSLDGDDVIGDSYVEVDLEGQKVFLYKDGKKLLETDCVSGTFGDPERETPGGVYSIYYKNSPDVLDGPGYSENVTYWMPFFGGYGLHDATWRSEFGDEIYKTNGSHGCINLPLFAARRIYNTVDIGYPVVLYK